MKKKMTTFSTSLWSMTLLSLSLLNALKSVRGFTLLKHSHRRNFASLTASSSVVDDSSSTLLKHSHRRNFASLTAFATSSSVVDDSSSASSSASPVPITLLSGFLGTGKTSALKHLLENTDSVKIGVIVNDVASVNVDAKLVSQVTKNGEMIELQNGCACCSLADELLVSVEKILEGRDLDALVVELSGVADPMAIKNNWKMAPAEIRQIADIRQVVTLVDSQTFGTDYMAWDVAQDREGWTDPEDPCAGNRKVSELLAEQVEAADLLLINKVDLATDEQVKIASKVATALNDKAQLEEVAFGKVSPKTLLGNVRQFQSDEDEKEESACMDPDCTDDSHSHSHAHDHAADTTCNDPDCTDDSHSHSHDHESSACSDPDCTDTSHSHSHDHESSTCSDPDCTDTSHSHSHDHGTSTEALGITNFVYKATRPFHTQRLLRLLNLWPVPSKDVLDLEFLKETANSAVTGGVDAFGKSTSDNPFVGVLRSKGFCWFAPAQWGDSVVADPWRHDTAMFWSHAGRHMSVNSAGKFWATIPREDMEKYFEDDKKEEMEKILREDFVTEEFGDRRQELIFIGIAMDENGIRTALDDCLLTSSEMDTYRQELQNYMNKIQSTTSSGLFGVGNEHLDQQ